MTYIHRDIGYNAIFENGPSFDQKWPNIESIDILGTSWPHWPTYQELGHYDLLSLKYRSNSIFNALASKWWHLFSLTEKLQCNSMHLPLIGGPYFRCLIDRDEICITYVTCTTQISKCSLHLYILNPTGETPDPMDLYFLNDPSFHQMYLTFWTLVF